MKLVHPMVMQLIGPSSCGKTYFVKRLIDENMIHPIANRIVYCFRDHQPLFNSMLNVEFHEGIPEDIYDSFDRNMYNLLVIDDLLDEKYCESLVLKIATVGSHHRSLSCIILGHNIFPKSAKLRTVSLNTSYYILFKNVRDKIQITKLAQQMRLTKLLPHAFSQATSEQWGYLLIDLKGQTNDKLRLRSKIFPTDNYSIVYTLK